MSILNYCRSICTDKKVYPPTSFNLSILLMITLHFAFPFSQIITGFYKFICLPFLIAGIAFNLIADKQFKQNSTTVKPFEESTMFIVDGIFKIGRNPMYLGMVLILLALAIFLGSLSPFLIILIFAFVINEFFIKPEEEMLKYKFAEEWNEYCKKVRRWI